MQSSSRLFTNTNNEIFVSTHPNIKQTSPKSLIEGLKLALNEHQEIDITLLILFKTENDTFVLCQNANPGISASLSSSETNKAFNEILPEIMKDKLLFNSDINDGEPGFRSQKNVTKLVSELNKSKFENIFCIHANQVTVTTSIKCKSETMLQIQNSLNTLAKMKNEISEYRFNSLTTLIANHTVIRLLSSHEDFKKFKKLPSLSALPEDIYLLIIGCLDKKSILSFLLTFKSMLFLQDEKKHFWKKLIAPSISPDANRYLINENYKQIFVKRTFTNFDSFTQGLEHAVSLYDFMTTDPITTSKSLFNRNVSDPYICYKKINVENINKYIIQDNDIELFHEASRIGSLLPYIFSDKIAEGKDYTENIDEQLSSQFESALHIADLKFILLLMPHIIHTHAEKCFDLLTQACFFVLKCFNDFNINKITLNDFGDDILLNHLIRIILDSKHEYFKLQLIRSALNHGSTDAIITIINASHQRNLSSLLNKALNEIDLTDERLIPIHYYMLNNNNMEYSNAHIQKIYDLKQQSRLMTNKQQDNMDDCKQLKNTYSSMITLFKNKVDEITTDHINSDEFREKSDVIKAMLDELLEAKINQEKFIASHEKNANCTEAAPENGDTASRSRFSM